MEFVITTASNLQMSVTRESGYSPIPKACLDSFIYAKQMKILNLVGPLEDPIS